MSTPTARNVGGAGLRTRSALALLGMLGVVGCGTTVPLTSRNVVAGSPSDGVTLTPPEGGQADGAGNGGSLDSTIGAAVAGSSAGQVVDGSVGRPGQVGGPANQGPGARAFGVTATTIYVGVPYSANGDAVLKAAGGKGTVGDQRAEARIVIDDINGRGGIYGRRLVPIYFPVDVTADQNTQRQAMCAAFTQDAKAFVAMAAIGADGNETVPQCMTKAGGVLVSENFSVSDQSVYHRYPGYVTPGDLSMDRAANARVEALVKNGYFRPWNVLTHSPGTTPSEVGILTVDAAPYRRTVSNVFLPKLRAHGQAVKPSNVVYVNIGSSDGGLAAMQSSMLRFQEGGVTHVLILDGGGGITLFAAQAARSQQYYPRYGLDSYNAAQVWLGLGLIQADVFTGAVGAGWVPLMDLASNENPLNGPNSNATRRRCVALQRAHGQRINDANAERHAVNICDALWFIEAALKAGGPVITRASFLRGVTKLGTSFVDGQTFSTRFSDVDHDGVASARPFRMESSCSCFRYSGPLAPIS